MKHKIAFLPWLFIAMFGTLSFWRVDQIQREEKRQQIELAEHQNAILNQLKINENLRAERSEAVSDAILKQCVQEYRIDGKIIHLAMGLNRVPSLDTRVKSALRAFAREVAQNQGELQCEDPLSKRLRQKSPSPSSIKITLHS